MDQIKYIGIGASAGGLRALQSLLDKLPNRADLVYIVIQHMSSDRKSQLAELLSRSTTIPVIEAQLEERLDGGNIYVIPPKFALAERTGRLFVTKASTQRSSPCPSIDDIFSTLAETKGANTVGIILSGTGDDGTQGLKAIKAADGIALAQLPSEAEYAGMPKSAIDSGVVDQILPAKNIGAVVAGLCSDNSEQKSLEVIRILLHDNEQFDLGKYKEKTVLRRIRKRMLLLHIDSLNAYILHMLKNKDETGLLYQDILIGVTKFFREPEAFDALKDAFVTLMKERVRNDEMRVWVTACSTGEEAYSIAIMLCELLAETSAETEIRIFATDIDDTALKIARKGSYATEALSEIEPRLRSKYFVKKDGRYEAAKRLRDILVFTQHDLLKDPPFINMDLISCRNALIYFTPPTQQEIFAMFHYALQEHGILFLGISETTSHLLDHFSAIDDQWKIYRKERLDDPPRLPKRYYRSHLPSKSTMSVSERSRETYTDIEQAIAASIYDFFMPECVVIDRKSQIVFTKGEVPYLSFGKGFASLDLFKNLHPSLHHEVRDVLRAVSLSKVATVSRFVELSDLSPTPLFVRVVASPFLFAHERPVTLLYFQELRSEEMVYASGRLDMPKEPELIASLEAQLSQTQTQLDALQDELEHSLEDTQMMNEELQSSNEELQASNEELETSNEELQASNEELNTSYRNTDSLKKELSKILESTPEGILGLDLSGKHTFVNSAAAKMLGYSVAHLIGRESHKTWHHTKADGAHYPEAECPVTHAFHTGIETRGEELFWRNDGSAFEVAFVSSPIKEEGEITGAVLFFHDITKKKEMERKLQQEQELTRLFLDAAPVVVMILDRHANVIRINQAGCAIFGVDADALIGENWIEHNKDRTKQKERKAIFDALMQGKTDSLSSHTNEILTGNGETRLIFWQSSPLRDLDGSVTGVISIGSDITEETALKERLQISEQKYALTFNEANIGIGHVGLDGRWLEVNRYLCELLGYSEDELLALTFQDITHPDDLAKDLSLVQQLLDDEIPSYQMEKRYFHKDGSTIWITLSVTLIRDELHRPEYFISAIQDISQIKSMIEELRVKDELMLAQSRQAAMGDMIAMIAHQWRQPISVIAMGANNMLADIDLNMVSEEEIRKLAEGILKQTAHLSKTIDDFRDFFRPDKAKERTTLCRIVKDTLSIVQKSLDSHGIKVVYDKTCEKELLTFPNELIQILLNLVTNAKDAILESKTKEGMITISIVDTPMDSKIILCDNGPGIKEDIIDRLGEPYVSTKGKNGTGLGLYMSITIVKKHLDGTLTWKNVEQGACFTLTIPAEV